jgi:hypothetical protein
MKNLKFDRIFAISPTFKSNSQLMKTLNIEDDDAYEDPDDPSVVDKIIEKINGERDDLKKYLREKQGYQALLKDLKSGASVRDDMLIKYFDGTDLSPPIHKYGGRNPFCGLIVDDCQGSKLYRDKKITGMVIRHRHIGAFEDDRPSIGVSCFFLIQNYKSQSGGISRSIRNNSTNLIIFKSKDEKELKQIADEVCGEVSTAQFMEAYETAMNDGAHPFLFVDLHAKDNHPSGLRSRFNKFLVPT